MKYSFDTHTHGRRTNTSWFSVLFYASCAVFSHSLSLGCFCVFYVYHCVSPHTHDMEICVYTVYCRLHSRMPILPMPIKLTIKLYVNIAWLYRIQIKHMHIKSHNGLVNDSSADNCWIYSTVSVSVSITRTLHTCTGCAPYPTRVLRVAHSAE